MFLKSVAFGLKPRALVLIWKPLWSSLPNNLLNKQCISSTVYINIIINLCHQHLQTLSNVSQKELLPFLSHHQHNVNTHAAFDQNIWSPMENTSEINSKIKLKNCRNLCQLTLNRPSLYIKSNIWTYYAEFTWYFTKKVYFRVIPFG